MEIKRDNIAKNHVIFYVQCMIFIVFFYKSTSKLNEYCSANYEKIHSSSYFSTCAENHNQFFLFYLIIILISTLQLCLTFFLENYFIQLEQIKAKTSRFDLIAIASTLVISNSYFENIQSSMTTLREGSWHMVLYFIVISSLFVALMRREIFFKSSIFRNEMSSNEDCKENFAFSIPFLYFLIFAFLVVSFISYMFYLIYEMKWTSSINSLLVENASSTALLGIIAILVFMIFLISFKKKIIIYEKGF